MKKFSVMTMIVILLLCACASGQTATATKSPAQTAVVTADASLATPNVGSATVKRLENTRGLIVQSQPDPKSAVVGQIALGVEGKVLGVNAEGTWVLVQFPEQTGWVPAIMLELILAQ
jgi:hypothetical protein